MKCTCETITCHTFSTGGSENSSSAHTRLGHGKTCAKVILFGEHSVVYGYPAVALPLRNLCINATVTDSCPFKNSLENSAFDFSNEVSLDNQNADSNNANTNNADKQNADSQNIDDSVVLCALDFTGLLRDVPKRLSSIRTAIHAALDFVGWDGKRLYVLTESDFPPERGLGSSAAAAGAVIRAILDYYGVEADKSKLFSLTQQAELVAHGRSSGLDAVATSSLAPVKYGDGSFSYMNIDMQAWIVLADSGCKGMTRVTVEALRKKREENPDFVNALLKELGDIALSAEDDLAQGRSKDMGARMLRAHKILAELGISTPLLDDLVNAAYNNGALGAKLTGGGGGGCVIALADSEDCARKVSEAFKSAGAKQTWIVDIDADANERNNKICNRICGECCGECCGEDDSESVNKSDSEYDSESE